MRMHEEDDGWGVIYKVCVDCEIKVAVEIYEIKDTLLY